MTRELASKEKKLQTKIDELEVKLAELRQKVASQAEKLGTANTQCKTSDDKIADLQLQLERAVETAREQAKKLKENKEDMNDLEHRHAAELAERDATVSDAEDILLSKETKIGELEVKLAELRQEVASQAEKLGTAEASHAEEVIRTAENEKRCQQLQSALDTANTQCKTADDKIAVTVYILNCLGFSVV